MKDNNNCLVCNSGLQKIHLTKNIIEKLCTNSYSHSFYLISNKSNKDILYFKFSLNPYFTRFLEVDYRIGQSVICDRDKRILVSRILEPDFPCLDILNNQLDLFLKLQ